MVLNILGKTDPSENLIKATRAYPIKLIDGYIPTFIYNVKDFTE